MISGPTAPRRTERDLEVRRRAVRKVNALEIRRAIAEDREPRPIVTLAHVLEAAAAANA